VFIDEECKLTSIAARVYITSLNLHSAGIYSATVSCEWKNLADTVRPQVLFLGSVCSSKGVKSPFDSYCFLARVKRRLDPFTQTET